MHGQHRQSVIASYAHAIAVALEHRGVDPRSVFREAEVGFPSATDPLVRIGNQEIGRLFAVATRITGDPCFGIVVGERMQPSYLHALGYALLASATLRDFYRRVCTLYGLASQNPHFRQYQQSGVSVLEVSDIPADVCYPSQDVFPVMMVRYMRDLYQRELNPSWIELIRPMPETGAQPFLDYFRCPVRFSQSTVRVAMPEAVMEEPLPGSNPELALQNDQVVMRYLERLDRSDIVTLVRSRIITELAAGEVCKQAVAQRLHMSARNLQTKLAARGTTFQEVLDSTRQQLALGYIEQRAMPIKEISYLLGFADTAVFNRAFRRWTGRSPSEFRGGGVQAQ